MAYVWLLAPGPRSFKLTNGYLKNRITANDRYLAFATSLERNRVGIVIYEFASRKRFVIRLPSGQPPYLTFGSSDPQILFITHAQFDKTPTDGGREFEVGPRTLLRCNIAKLDCRPVFSLQKSIHDVFEIDGEGLLFVSGYPRLHADHPNPQRPNLIFSPNDFYLRAPTGEIRRLTNIEFLSLGLVSITEGRVIFHANYLRKGVLNKAVRRKVEAQNRKLGTSLIYAMEFDGSAANLKITPSIFEPIVRVGSWWNSQPSATRGSAILAFQYQDNVKRKSTRIAVYDMKKSRLIGSASTHSVQSASRPFVTGQGRVLFLDYYDENYHIMEYSVANRSVSEIDQISISDISAIKPVPLSHGLLSDGASTR